MPIVKFSAAGIEMFVFRDNSSFHCGHLCYARSEPSGGLRIIEKRIRFHRKLLLHTSAMTLSDSGISVGITDSQVPDNKSSGGERGFEPSIQGFYFLKRPPIVEFGGHSEK